MGSLGYLFRKKAILVLPLPMTFTDCNPKPNIGWLWGISNNQELSIWTTPSSLNIIGIHIKFELPNGPRRGGDVVWGSKPRNLKLKRDFPLSSNFKKEFNARYFIIVPGALRFYNIWYLSSCAIGTRGMSNGMIPGFLETASHLAMIPYNYNHKRAAKHPKINREANNIVALERWSTGSIWKPI